MKINFTVNFIKIYFWNFISIILNFAALFVVVPYISSNKELYGVYALCMSLNIFLSYADLGFIGAGKKFASEYFANNDLKKSIDTIGFSVFFLSIFLIFFIIGFAILGFSPELMFGEFINNNTYDVASSLFFILSFSTPIILFQQLVNSIFGIRLENYIPQKINILGSLIKIVSIFYFFNNTYDLVGYFIFFQFINFLAVIAQLFVINSKYKLNIINILSTIKFNKKIYDKVSKLAYSSLFITISWILYYELDNMVIGKILGPSELAIYAVGFTILGFYRSLIAIFYSPFVTRFNHFIGLNQMIEFDILYKDLVKFSVPIIIIPIMTLIIFAEPLVISWVGNSYADSIIIVKLLLFANIFSFISIPTSLILNSLLRLKELYIINTIIPIVFWIGILTTIEFFGVKSFALFKLISFMILAFFCSYIYIDYTKSSIASTVKNIVKSTISPSLLFVYFAGNYLLNNYPIYEKSSINLLKTSLIVIIVILLAFIIQILIDKDIKSKIFKLYNKEI